MNISTSLNAFTNRRSGDPVQPSSSIRVRRTIKPLEISVALPIMEADVAAIRDENFSEILWFLEHESVITLGTSASPEHVRINNFPIQDVNRGGAATFHGPGQRIVYVMMDLRKRGNDIRLFVLTLENWIIGALARLGIHAWRHSGYVGIWVHLPSGKEAKLAAIGLRVRHGVTFHGIAINVTISPDSFDCIMPCAIAGLQTANFPLLGITATVNDLDRALLEEFPEKFGSHTFIPDEFDER